MLILTDSTTSTPFRKPTFQKDQNYLPLQWNKNQTVQVEESIEDCIEVRIDPLNMAINIVNNYQHSKYPLTMAIPEHKPDIKNEVTEDQGKH